VEDISFVGKGDQLIESVIYLDKSGAKRNFWRIIMDSKN
jgi:hypothetical protein